MSGAPCSNLGLVPRDMNGAQFQQSTRTNADSFMCLPAFLMSFSSNNISSRDMIIMYDYIINKVFLVPNDEYFNHYLAYYEPVLMKCTARKYAPTSCPYKIKVCGMQAEERMNLTFTNTTSYLISQDSKDKWRIIWVCGKYTAMTIMMFLFVMMMMMLDAFSFS
ncbi:uncharacterized protein LOC125529068 isoform X2 [Triticum urartu]|uniref:uncharacterized protein LOC125529068 isoform X2 n=1 Tax=Triticum urartu TaxID=4572 RepID=UPI002043FF29|nr:uncharacterized protein LOC125529068 isoform X2 [Triticum urartu]